MKRSLSCATLDKYGDDSLNMKYLIRHHFLLSMQAEPTGKSMALECRDTEKQAEQMKGTTFVQYYRKDFNRTIPIDFPNFPGTPSLTEEMTDEERQMQQAIPFPRQFSPQATQNYLLQYQQEQMKKKGVFPYKLLQ